ncbi:MOSC domain-containing protein [Dehalobacter sp. DCM]|uniref:MOSC domain-containing protein n=1 Tax=Dehalobacter sp. DCM TaxID=2907827 RepID=UPI003081986C|nr:MOSC domain-containing protein [Dehalobacter sp. DCM]
MKKGTIFSISIRSDVERKKKEILEAIVLDSGIQGDGYSQEWGRQWGRQISCLNLMSIMTELKERNQMVVPGEYGENILVDGIDLFELNVGDRLILGEMVLLEVTQIGKERSTIPVPKTVRMNLLSSEGVFCKVIKGGVIKKGHSIRVIEKYAR